ncbi:MAG TPA: MipA/OmpV family protein [Methylibium sp.]|nr:MipA/OmpV family protein [Methylibium sp.]
MPSLFRTAGHVVRALVPVLAAALPAAPAVGQSTDGARSWSVGLGVVAMRLPDYRGSDESSNRVLPFPAVTYEGPRLQVGREGVRAGLLEGSRFELDVSLNGSLPVRSAGNRAREGMDDLDPTVEVGPSLRAWLWRDPARRSEFALLMPLRATLSVDGSGPHMHGWQFAPRLHWRGHDVPGLEGWRVDLSGGPMWGSRRWHAYFYDVPPQDARADRPAYAAPGGYAGLQGMLSASREVGRWGLFGFVRADHLRGAVFEASPLVRRTSHASIGIGLTRSLWSSAATGSP